MIGTENYYKPLSKKWRQIIIAINGLSYSLMGAAFLAEKPQLAFGILLVNAVSKELIKLSEGTNEKSDETGTQQ